MFLSVTLLKKIYILRSSFLPQSQSSETLKYDDTLISVSNLGAEKLAHSVLNCNATFANVAFGAELNDNNSLTYETSVLFDSRLLVIEPIIN